MLGESGAGKSTLAFAALGMLPPAFRVLGGTVEFRGANILKLSERERRKLRGTHISLISQNPELALNPVRPIGSQVGEMVRVHTRRRWRECKELARDMLETVGISARLWGAYPHQLSGGQRQRVVIAQALVCGPSVLIADEPTTALDAKLQVEILELLKTLRDRRGLAVLFITHEPFLLRGINGRLLVMHRGRVVEEGPLERILQHPSHAYTQALVSAIPPMGHGRICPEQPPCPAILAGRNLAKCYLQGRHFVIKRKPVKALDCVSVSLFPGRTLAIVGESGAGKSTLARCLSGLELADSGDLIFDGNAIRPSSVKQMRRDVQMIFQGSAAAMNPSFTALEIVEEPLRIRSRAPGKQLRERALAIMAQVGLASSIGDRRSMELSGGQRQRLAIARALILESKLLILDEPFVGLDPCIQAEVIHLLLELQESLSLSYVFITHDLRLAAHLGHQIAVMKDGRIVEAGLVSEVLSQPRNPYTQALVRAAAG